MTSELIREVSNDRMETSARFKNLTDRSMNSTVLKSGRNHKSLRKERESFDFLKD